MNQFDEEVQFMWEYFHNSWSKDRPQNRFGPVEELRNLIVSTKCNSEDSFSLKKKRKIAEIEEEKEKEVTTDSSSLDPIVSFNVEGEIFSILRSTILRVIPNSQLAMRVSGRWEEQAEKGDIDEEGNLVVNCHKESFRQIISALQMTCFGLEFQVLVNCLCRNAIEETLNYLLITPKLLIFTDPY
jgi:hypothetical protein